MLWRPKTFKLRYMPGDNCNIDALCGELVGSGLVVLYGDGMAVIPTFRQHQHVNPREQESKLPAPDEELTQARRVATRADQEQHAQVGKEGKGREGKGKEERVEARASRFALDSLPSDWGDFCRRERQDLDPFATFDRFRDYWRSVPGAKGRKLDWPATWRNWVRNERADRPKAKQSPDEVAAEAIRLMEQRDAQARAA